MRYVRETDPFHRPLTIHPTAIQRYTARHATDDAALLDFDMLQTPHGQREAVPVAVNAVRESYAADAGACRSSTARRATRCSMTACRPNGRGAMFWLCLMNGAAGHTYGANGIWQCNRPGQPHGASPHGGSYGKIPWNEAMHLPGSRQVGFGKKLLEQYPWQQLPAAPRVGRLRRRIVAELRRLPVDLVSGRQSGPGCAGRQAVLSPDLRAARRQDDRPAPDCASPPTTGSPRG